MIPPPPLPSDVLETSGDRSGERRRRHPVPFGPGRLTARWRWVLIAGWVMVVYGISAAGQAGDQLGKPPWWLDPLWLAWIPYVLPMIAVSAAIRNDPRSGRVGAAATVATLACAAIDVRASPGVAAVTALVAIGGGLCTAGAASGRVRAEAAGPA